jgi:hypothetical protein
LRNAQLEKEMANEAKLKAEKAQELYNFEKYKKESDLDNATEEW